MTHPVGNTANTLNSASLGGGRSRSAHGGAGFAAINAMAAAQRAPMDNRGGLNGAGVDPAHLLQELNQTRRSPDIAAAAAINAAVRAHDDENEARHQSEQHEELTRQAQKLVSQTFFGPMLKQMRNSPFKSELFEGGRGGQVFSSMFDQHLADRMAGSTNNKLVSAIVRQLEQRGQPAHKPANPYQNVRVHVAPGLGS